MRLIPWLITYTLFVSMGAYAQPAISIRLDSSTMTIGDYRKIMVLVDTDDAQTSQIIIPQAFPLEFITPLTLEGSSQEAIFSVYDTGYVRIPALGLQFELNGSMDTVYSNDLGLEVLPVPIDSLGLAPIKDIIVEPIKLIDVLPYAGGLLLLLAALAIFFYVQNRRKQIEPQEIVVQIPPHDKAMNELNELEKQKLWQSGQIKAYQSKLTGIIRQYLEDEFNLKALESTTGEIIAEVRKLELGEQWNEQLAQVLNVADLVKFAKAQPTVDIHKQFLDLARDLVRTAHEQMLESKEVNHQESIEEND